MATSVKQMMELANAAVPRQRRIIAAHFDGILDR